MELGDGEIQQPEKNERDMIVREDVAEEKKVPPKSSYPPGYRFMPTDEELINHYLKNKVNNQPIPVDQISDVYLMHNNPKALSEKHGKLGDNEWYFFTPRERKYPNGSRPNRAANIGYWKATGADRPVYSQGEIIGFRKALVFYEGKPPRGVKTSWIMHEFRLKQAARTKASAHDMRLDDWVLCRIYEKPSRPNNRRAVNNPLQVNTPPETAIDLPESVIGNPISDELMMRGYGYGDEESVLLNGHHSFLDYELIDQVQHYPFGATTTPVLSGQEQPLDFQHCPMYFGSSSSSNTIDFQPRSMYFGPSANTSSNNTIDFQHSPMYFGSTANTTIFTDSLMSMDGPNYKQHLISKKRRL